MTLHGTDLDEWPILRWLESRKRWQVDARTKNGGQRKYFEKRKEAETWAIEQRAKRATIGDAAFGSVIIQKPKQEWPFKSWDDNRQRWRVDARTKNGGERLSFKTEDEADAWRDAQLIKRKNEGDDAFGLNAADRIDAQTAHRIIADHARSGVPSPSLRDCVNFYFQHHEVAKGDKTVRQVLEELLASKKASGLSEKYLKDIRTRVGMFAYEFGDEKIINISTNQVDSYVLGLPRLDTTTKNNHRRLLGVLFNFAKDKGYILNVPISKQSKSREKYGKPEILTVEEASRLLTSCEDDILPAVAIGLFAGLRPEAELWRLDWRKVHLDRKKIDVDETKDEGHHASVRWVDMPDNLVAWLLPQRKTSGPICPTGDAYYTRIQRAKEAAGINRPTPDGLRHSFCSYHYAAYQDAGLTMAQAGHTNPRTFFRHYRQRVLREDAESYFNIFPAQPDEQKIVPLSAGITMTCFS
jgi:integrase